MNTLTKEIIQKMTDEQVYEALTKDFLERDGDTFVRIRRTGRLGWEETMPKGTAYSERMLSPKTTEELLKAAYTHASDMIKAMNTPFPVSVNVSGDQSWTDFKQVFVASKLLEDENLSIGQRLDAFTGYAVHEGSHLLYSDLQFTQANPPRNEIIRFLRNVLEDEMIEIRLGEDKPGLANFLACSKYHAFNRYVEELKNNPKARKVGLTDIVNAILSMVRYPKLLTPDVINENGRLLLQVREVIKRFPENTQEVNEAAEKIYEILLDQYKPKSEDENQDQEKQGDSSETDDQNKSEDQTEGTGNSENNQQGNPDNQKKSSKNKDRQSGGNSSRGASSRTNGSQENADNEADAAKRLMDDFDDIKNELENLATEPKQGLQDKELASGFNKERKELARECEGKLERGSEKDRIIIKVPENKGAYEDSLQRVRRYIPTVSNILKSNGTEYKTSLRGLRSGMMDPCKIAEAFQGVPSIYMRESKVKADRMTVSLLIDESGSMDGEKIIAARDTAILFREALKNVANISLYVYGYTSDGKKNILCKYIEPGYAPKYSMGSMDSRRGTPTAEAISETVKRITLNKEEQALMIVISDGYPNSSNEEVAAQVKNAERKGIKVMGISIDDDLPESALKKMYGKYIKYSDMGSLVSSLSKVLKKEVLENTQKKYSA